MDLKSFKLDLQKLISYNSVLAPKEPNAPFGKETADCLNCFLDIAKGFGFKTINYDNYAGEVEFGNGEEFGILCHLDIVPVGAEKDWKTPPFTLVDDGEKLIGRGVLDDKGPALLILYALKDLKENGFIPSKKIRLILGCNEESGWGCINHLKSLNKMPSFGFSPDAEFPVIYAEKGILHVEFAFDLLSHLEIQGGKAYNMVCDYLKFKCEIDQEIANKYNLTISDGYIHSYGKTAHGSSPRKGQNAIINALKYLIDKKIVSQEILQKLFFNSTKILDLKDETGNLTLSPNIISSKDNKLYILCDIRFPATLDKDFVLGKLSEIAPFNVKGYQPSIFIDKKSKLVTTLSKTYTEVTGESLEPVAIGGGTYARSMPNCVAFGPVINEEDGVCHEPNEYMTIKNLLLAYKIYKKAITNLAWKTF